MLLVGAVTAIAASYIWRGDAAGDSAVPRVQTDGHFSPESSEEFRVSGFPGRGWVAIVFIPTALCEGECEAPTRSAGHTNKAGSARLHVRVPGFFLNFEGKRVGFLNRERIELEVVWHGSQSGEVVVASPRHAPVFRRPAHLP